MTPGTRVPLTEGELTQLELYLSEELDEGVTAHMELESRLSEWDRAYLGEPKQAHRNFPWPGAANIEIPIIGIHVDSIVARIVNTLFAMEPFWKVRPINKMVEPITKPLEDYLQWSQRFEFNLYPEVRKNSIELTKYGWSWYKYGWENFRQPQVVTGTDFSPIIQDKVIRRPNVWHISNFDMIEQPGVEDFTQSEWLCHRIRLTNNQMRLRKRDGIYDVDVDKAMDTKEDANLYHDQMRSSRTSMPPQKERLNTLYEVWLDWPWGAERVPVPMLAVWHRQLKKVIRLVFNPYGFRPFKKPKFIEREGRREGMGIARRLWQIQEELSTLHRQQIDNSTIANTRFWVGKKNVVKHGTQIWPGRVFVANDPHNDLVPHQLGDIYQSQGFLEGRALAYAERASGVSDYQLGRESATSGARATATGTLALIQEGNRRFDLNVRDAREVMSEIGRDIIILNQMYRPRGLAYFVQGADGRWTESLLNLPPDFAASQLAVELTATTATINKEIEKQGLIALYGQMERHHMAMGQALMIMSNPQMPAEVKEYAMKAANGQKYLLDRIVRTFDVKAVDTIVPGIIDEQQAEASGIAGLPTPDQAERGLAVLSQLYKQSLGASAGRNGERGDVA